MLDGLRRMFNTASGKEAALSGEDSKDEMMEVPHGEEVEDDEVELSLVYSSIPLTLALRKRQFDEQQRKKYGIPKEKKFELR